MESPIKADIFSTFHELCAKLLTLQERKTLHRCLQAYQTTGQLAMFVADTFSLWTCPSKLQLLPFVRQVIAVHDRPQFDALLGIHEGFVIRGPKSDRSSSKSSTKSGNHPLGRGGAIHVVKVSSAASPRMGFSVRGGNELGLGIYVSQVEPDSPAEEGGLRCGDQILETNGVDVEQASSERAVELLSTTHTQTLVVRRTRKIPEWKVTKERILWYDVATQKLVATSAQGVSAVEQPGTEAREITERKVVLRLGRKKDFVGLNIRGGKDFGLGIYVSRVDRGGLAERAGVEVGDQVVQVNEHTLDKVTHSAAVQLLRANKQLVLTLWTVGKFPAYKERFTEYVWSDGDDIIHTEQRIHTAELHPEPRSVSRRQRGRSTQRTKTRESRIDRSPRDSGIDLNGIDLHSPQPDYDDDTDDVYEEDLPTQTKVFYPRDKDIIFRGNYTENWRRLDKAYDTAALSSVSSRRASKASLTQRTVSSVDTDTDSSDTDMDYTAFLERKVRKDEEKASTSRGPLQHSVIEDSVLVQDYSPAASYSSSASPAGQSGKTQPTLVTATDRAEPRLVKKTYISEPVPAGEVPSRPREPVLLTERGEKTVENNGGTSHESLTPPRQDREPVGMQTVDRADPTLITGRDDGPEHPVLNEGTEDDPIYAVVKKPARRGKGDDYTVPPAVGHHRSPDTLSSSSSGHSQDSSSTVTGGHSRHHRTHIYHINSSPTLYTKRDHRAPVLPAADTTGHRNGAGDEVDNDEDYVVMTEVMDEVATRVPSPPADYRRSSIASSTSNSSSTVSDTAEAMDLLTEEIRRLEARQSNIGSREIFTLGDVHTAPAQSADKHVKEQLKTEADKKGGKWSAIKKKLTGSIRIKKNNKQNPVPYQAPETVPMGSIRKKGVFERSFGSQMMNQQTEDKYNVMMVEERARKLLTKDGSEAVLRHLRTYQEHQDLDRLVEVLMAILDKADKLQLLKDVRGVLLPGHVGRFDSLVARHQATVFEQTSSKLHLPLSAVHRTQSALKPRSRLMTTVMDANGHFHIQSLEHQQQDGRLQNPVADTSHQASSAPYTTSSAPYTTSHQASSAPYTTTSAPYTTSHQASSAPYTTSKLPHHPASGTGNRHTPTITNGVPQQHCVTRNNNPVRPPLEWRDDVKVIIVEKEPVPSPPAPPPPEEGFVVYLSKQKKNLGLIVCGGAGDHMDSSLRIEMVMPWGAAADEERIQSGMHIVSVDDQSVKGMTQSEAIALLKRCFTNTRSVNMKLRIKMP